MIPGIEKSQVTFSFLHGYLAILMKHARLAMLLTALSATLSLFYYTYARQVYHGQVLIQVKQLSRPTDDNVDYTDESMYYTLQQQIQSDHILEHTAHSLGLSGRQGTIRRKHCKKVIAKFNSESNLMVDVYTYSYDMLRVWPDAMYNTFEKYRQERRLQRRQRQIDSWIFDRKQVLAKIAEIDEEKKQVISTRQEWELKMGMVELKEVPELLIATKETIRMFEEIDKKLQEGGLDRESRLAILERAQQEAKVDIGEIVPGVTRQSKTEVYPQEGASVILLPEMVRTSDEGWTNLNEDLVDLSEKLDMRLKIYREAHPEIVELKQKITDVEKRLEKDVQSMQNKFYFELTRLKSKKVELDGKLDRYKKLSIKVSEFEREMSRVDVARQPWERLLAKLNVDLDKFDVSEDRELFLLLPPEVMSLSETPVIPDLKKTAMMTLIISLLFGLGIPFLLEYLDNTFTVAEDAERELGIQNLGIVPRVPVPEQGQSPELGKAPRMVQETFRMIRTNLITKSDFSDKRQVIMVSSSLPREGKSMFSFNLAESFANLGERTLLIDLDLRRGHLNRCFNQPRDPGITDMLMSSETGSINVCRATHHELLNFVPGGTRIDNVTEVLASSAFADFMTRVRRQYDRIIVDTPPVLGLAETTGVLPLVDGVVMVIWSSYTPADQVKVAVNQLRNNGGKFLGFVLNQLDLKCPTNYFRYYYFSDYYYTSYKS